jgi:hypothetical protein
VRDTNKKIVWIAIGVSILGGVVAFAVLLPPRYECTTNFNYHTLVESPDGHAECLYTGPPASGAPRSIPPVDQRGGLRWTLWGVAAIFAFLMIPRSWGMRRIGIRRR